MGYFDVFRNYVNALTGTNQEFEQLIEAHDIDAVKSKMVYKGNDALAALEEYDVHAHEITKREDKLITDSKGKVRRKERVWKLPIPYQRYINEVALVFLYGQPIKWSCLSDGTDEAFAKFQKVIKSTRFNSKIREAKRIAGAETQSAMLFRVYKDGDGNPDVQIRVLARSKGDEIYVRWDMYENITAIGWGYYAREDKDTLTYHFDIFTKSKTYHCAKKKIGWEVVEEASIIGKIPIILFEQEKEWAGVEHLIYREEYIASRTADTNDYFSDPVMVMNADTIRNLPEKKEAAKTLFVKGEEKTSEAAHYLTWDSAPQSKSNEIAWLQDQILNKSFTPSISLDTLKSLSNLSGKALKTVMLLADIKASRHKERHEELIDRTASLLTAIIGSALNVSLASQCKKMEVGHSFQEPFGDDVESSIDNIIKGKDGGILSQETAIELNPLVQDKQREMERISEEEAESMVPAQNVFDTQSDEIAFVGGKSKPAL